MSQIDTCQRCQQRFYRGKSPEQYCGICRRRDAGIDWNAIPVPKGRIGYLGRFHHHLTCDRRTCNHRRDFDDPLEVSP